MCHFETRHYETGHFETATLRNQSLRNQFTFYFPMEIFKPKYRSFVKKRELLLECCGFEVTGFGMTGFDMTHSFEMTGFEV
uniref:Uncharacterized protein n=1 Tax=Caenorhabditis tropicalis TaxID=1561998 RepID=A0A1I7UZW9_9PELO